jgi:lambda family phage minor tail protein L
MGEGFNKENMSEMLDFDPSSILDFFLLYYNYPDDDFSFVAISPSSNGAEVGIIWQGQQYLPMPIETEGFRTVGGQELPKPKIRISNKDFFMSRYIANFGDFAGKKVIRKRVFAKFLDDANFKGGNPFGEADPDAGFPDEIYYINNKSVENKSVLEYQLATPLEMENYTIPSRGGYARYCSWIYRGYGCRYNGVPKTNKNGDSFGELVNKGAWSKDTISYSVNDFVYIENKAYILTDEDSVDPTDTNTNEGLKVYFVCKEAHTSNANEFPSFSKKWEKDACKKNLTACNLRFDSPLPFGGFAGTYEYQSQI